MSVKIEDAEIKAVKDKIIKISDFPKFIQEFLSSRQDDCLEEFEALMIKRDVDINYRDKYGKSSLLRAAGNGNIPVVEYLLENKLATMLERTNRGSSPLILAASNGHILMVGYFLKNKLATISERNDDGLSSLLWASLSGHIQMVEYLLKKGSEMSERSKEGYSPLLLAAWNGHIQMVEYLLKNGAKISERSKDGSSPLLLASSDGHIKMVEYLLKNELSTMSERDDRGFSPLLQAAYNGHVPMVRYFLKKKLATMSERSKSGASPLLLAVRNGHIPMVSYFIRNKLAKMSERNKDGDSPFLLAAYNGHIPMVEFLFKNNLADSSERNDRGDSSLLLAVANNHIPMLDYLLTNKLSKLSEKNKQDRSPLLVASSNGHSQVVEYLLKNGSQMSERSKEGYSPLLLAALNGHIQVVEYLLKNGAEMSERSKEGYSPLLLASSNGHIQVVEYLLKNGAEMSERSKEGYSPLLLASLNGHIRVVEYLLKNGAEMSERSKEGYSSLLLAATSGHILAVQYLLNKGACIDVLTNLGDTISQVISNSPQAEKIALPVIVAAETLLRIAPHADENSVELSNALKTLNVALNGRQIADGNTALHLAILHKNKALVRILLKEGADIHLDNDNKRTPQQLGLTSDIPYIKLYFNLSNLDELSRAPIAILMNTEKDAFKDTKEIQETKEFKEPQEQNMIQPETLNKLIEEIFKGIQGLSEQEERNELLYKLGVLLSNVDRPSFRPLLAYQIFNTITPQALKQYESANFKVYELIKGGHIIVSKAKDQLDEEEIEMLPNTGLALPNDDIYRYLKLKTLLKHLHLANYQGNEDDMFGKLVAEFALGEGENTKGIPGLTGINVRSQLILLNLLQKTRFKLENEIKTLKINIFNKEEPISSEKQGKEGFSDEVVFVESMLMNFSVKTDVLCNPKERKDKIEEQYNLEPIKETSSEKGNDGDSPLLLAAANGQISKVEHLLKNKLAEISERNKYGDSPLLLAAANGHIPIAVYLLKKGSIISERNNHGYTALLLAARNGYVKMVEYLLKKGAKMSERDSIGRSPLLIAAANGQVATAEYFINKNLAKITERNNEGNSPLLLAALRGQIGMVKYLLKMGAAVSERNNNGNSPLLLAAGKGHTSMVEYLLENKLAEVSESNNLGNSSLLFAAYNGHISTVQYLLKKGAFVDGLKNSGNTISQGISNSPRAKNVGPVIVAAETLLRLALNVDENSTELSNALKALNEVLNGRQIVDGNTALHLAILHKNKALVRLLLERGADIHLANNAKSTPLQLGLSSEVPYIQHCFNLAKLNELSKAQHVAIQTDTDEEAIRDPKEAKESKESLEKSMIQPEVLDKLIEESLKGIQSLSEQEEKSELLYKLGSILSNADSPSFRPLVAYKIFNTIISKTSKQYEAAHSKAFELVMGGHIIISKAKDKLEEELEVLPNTGFVLPNDEVHYHLRLKTVLKHLHLSNYQDNEGQMFGKLVAEFALGGGESMKGIPGLTGISARSQFILVNLLQKTRLKLEKEIKALKEEIHSKDQKLNREKQEKEKLGAEIESLKSKFRMLTGDSVAQGDSKERKDNESVQNNLVFSIEAMRLEEGSMDISSGISSVLHQYRKDDEVSSSGSLSSMISAKNKNKV